MKTSKTLLITLISLFSFLTQAQEIDLNKGLVAHYDFTNEAEDISGNGNDGEVIKVNLEEDVTGERRGSYRFNNDKDKIILPIDINPISMPQVTLTAWVKPLRYMDQVIVLSNDDRGGDRKIYMQKMGNKRVWAISVGEGKAIGKTEVETGDWTFLVATYHSETNLASIYVNGEKTSGETNIDRGSDQLYIGANPYGNDDFEALIDEVRVYNRILSSAEIDSLKKTITPKQKAEKKEEEHYYLVTAKLAAKAKPDKNASDVAVLEKGDTLRSLVTVNAVGGKYKEYLEVELDGTKAYVPLKYLDKVYVKDLDKSRIEKFMEKYMSVNTWSFWIIMVLMLVIGLGASFKFPAIDGLIGAATGSDYENVAFFPIITGFVGFLSAILVIIWQDDIDYYFSNFSFWPSGYGFAAWAVWVLLLLILIGLILLIVESFSTGNVVHGVLRLVIQLILGLFTFASIMTITAAIIIIAIIVTFVIILLSAAFMRRRR
jgi:hypothetical protein